MAQTMNMFSGRKITTLSINKIAEAIHDAVAKLNKPLLLHESSDFGGTSSAAFKEGLVREYNKEHLKECPKCGLTLSFLNDGTADCQHCKTTYTFPKEDADLCYISEEGIAEFIGRKIGNGYAHPTGDCYHLGAVGGRTLYYGTTPNKQFYNKHKGDNIALVLGSNHAEVPDNWCGHLVPFSELFYVNEATGEIKVSRNRLHDLLPNTRTKRLPKLERKILDRRNNWLMFIANLLCQPYRDADFFHGGIRPKVARDWFIENVPGAPKGEKEYQRDLRAFRYLSKDSSKPDSREQVIVLLLRIASDRKRTLKDRKALAKIITDLVLYLEKGELKNGGRPIEITRGAWQFCADGSKEYVPVVDLEKHFDSIDEKDACSA